MKSLWTTLRTVAVLLMQSLGRAASQDGASEMTDEEVLEAVNTEDLERIALYLKNPANRTRKLSLSGQRFYPLHLACALGKFRVVDMFVRAKAGVNLQDQVNGFSPLFIASQNGYQQIVDLLIKGGADVDIQQNTGDTPLTIASHCGHQKVVESLIKARADVNLQLFDGTTPLYIAAQSGHAKVVDSLIKAQADVNLQRDSGVSPLFIACQSGHQRVVDLLIKAQADPNLRKNSNSPSTLHIASIRGYDQIVDSLIKAQVEVDLQISTGESALFIASHKGHRKIVESLVKGKADVNLKNIHGCSPLYIAAQQGHWQVVTSLIKAQADVNLQERVNGSSALYIASQQGHQEVLDLLITALVDIDLQNRDGISPLHIASQNGHQRIAGSLIKAQAHIDRQEIVNGSSPLYIASQNGHRKVVDSLIKAQADVNHQRNTGETALIIASHKGHHQIVDSLIKAQADVNLQEDIYGCSPLFLASQNGHHQIVNSVIKAQADINLQQTDRCSPIYIASQNNNKRVVDLLIKAQADVNTRRDTGESPLYIASHEGHSEIAESLITAKADVNFQRDTGESPIYIASQNGHHRVVTLLVKSQANVNLQLNTGESPLYIASQNGHQLVVEVLIKAQADVNLQRDSGESPLYIACHLSHLQVVHLLIEAKADVNLSRKTGESPLFVASQNGHQQVVTSLLRTSANVDFQLQNGTSPLHIASHNGHQQVVVLLIRAQANVDVQSNAGETPLFIAARRGHQEIVDLLIKAQADVNLQRNDGCSPLQIASLKGHRHVVRLLMLAQADMSKSVCSLDENLHEADLSISEIRDNPSNPLGLQLHSMLIHAGFVDSRAALQSAVADVLQEILRRRQDYDKRFVVGSYSEGWGNNLKTLDGRTDVASDIDVMELIPGKLYHPTGICKCSGYPVQHELSNGHLQCKGYSSNPALPSDGSALRPAMDRVTAGRLCRYPPIAPLQPHRISRSNIPKPVLQALQKVVDSDLTPCHVVHAASPGRGGQELRVSTSFLEKRMLRSLTTLQGQLFVTLKYLVKKVICSKDGFNQQGLKSYHVKSITFRMVEETPVEQWKPENLVSLVRRSLQMLLGCVESSRSPDNAHGRIMEHFFLSDVAVYLKGAVGKDGSMDQTLGSIASTLRTVIDRLPQLLQQFMSSLRPVDESGIFYFHPFQTLPVLVLRSLPNSNTVEYHEIYDVVRECLVRLSHGDCSPLSQESLTELIARLPDCAGSAREALRALACLKFGYRGAAERIVSQCRGLSVSRGIAWSAEKSATEATTEFVWRHLRSRDSAWKFCFEFERRPKLIFLTGVLIKCFPLKFHSGADYFYLNFDALLWALRLELLPDSEVRHAKAWIQSVAEREDADIQELLVAALFSVQPKTDLLIFEKLLSLNVALPRWLTEELQRKWQLAGAMWQQMIGSELKL